MVWVLSRLGGARLMLLNVVILMLLIIRMVCCALLASWIHGSHFQDEFLSMCM